ncbi:hypothetical protein DFP72DRAFT_855461 [Ephemerocybe angulata]|uniref:Uncharacterized protein n=1 Tax=Ephemerocybe angulata TaxID=980116 RepID=A0A8H6HG43_9AGAR|nr:hypothetical protein DFP72DRAFT_855461 [Tulosesus angulatus]
MNSRECTHIVQGIPSNLALGRYPHPQTPSNRWDLPKRTLSQWIQAFVPLPSTSLYCLDLRPVCDSTRPPRFALHRRTRAWVLKLSQLLIQHLYKRKNQRTTPRLHFYLLRVGVITLDDDPEANSAISVDSRSVRRKGRVGMGFWGRSSYSLTCLCEFGRADIHDERAAAAYEFQVNVAAIADAVGYERGWRGSWMEGVVVGVDEGVHRPTSRVPRSTYGTDGADEFSNDAQRADGVGPAPSVQRGGVKSR